MRALRFRLSRLCRSRLSSVLVSALGLASFTLYLVYQSSALVLMKSGRGAELAGRLKATGHGPSPPDGGRPTLADAGPAHLDKLLPEDATVKKRKSRKKQDINIEDSPIYKHLQQLESRLLQQAKALKSRTVEVRGQPEVISRDLPLYERAFTKQGCIVRQPTKDRRDGYSNRSIPVQKKGSLQAAASDEDLGGWMVLLCLAFTDGDSQECLQRSSFTRLHAAQKINRIPGVRNVLWRKDGFCHTMNQARRIPAFQTRYLSPSCWVMPSQYAQFLGVADALGDEVRWVFKSTSPGGKIEVLQPTKDKDYARVKEFRSKRAVVQQYFPNPLLVFGMPVNVRVYVLVTSVNPLRAYIHSEGLVHFRHDYQRGFKKIPNRTWYLAQFKHYLKYNFGYDAAEMAFQSLASVIVETLLVAESSLVAHFGRFRANPWDDQYRCTNCFQLLGFDVIFNSTLHPMVIEVNGQPHLQAGSDATGWASASIKQNAVDDAVSLLLAETLVARDVAKALENLQLNVGILDVNCRSNNQMCLTRDDLVYLLATRREAVNRGSYLKLYPSYTSPRYDGLLRDIQRFLVPQTQLGDVLPYSLKGALLTPPGLRHGTAELRRVTSDLELQYREEEEEEGGGSRGWGSAAGGRADGGLEADGGTADWEERDNGTRRLFAQTFGNNAFEIDPMYQDPRYHRPRCSDDPSALPELLDFRTDPAIDLSPTFDPQVTEYHASVPHEVALIKVWAFARSCDSEARLEEKNGLSRPANYTLGVGQNRITMLVVDITHSDPWVLNTYTVVVQRRSVTDGEAPMDTSQTHQVCSLVQECSLQFLQGASCGLTLVPSLTWKDYVKSNSRLPLCQSGDTQGEWLLPCTNCVDRASCFWKEARWQPRGCKYQTLHPRQIQKCLAGKKLLFLGDSTNRGMMYYLMERLNGTLLEWDKTHDLKVYSRLNGGQTAASFAYYPQFWRPAGERPVLDKALHQLVSHSRPLADDREATVLVVGGVHWLATHHLRVIQRALDREGLSNIRKVMKGLGAGFHQPVDGVHCLSLKEQRKMVYHNRVIVDYAKTLGFDVVDTFNMTMARYREFLLGKCACHFHRVNEVIPDEAATNASTIQKLLQYLRPSATTSRASLAEDRQQRALYHVTGDINAVYSDILVSQLCGA